MFPSLPSLFPGSERRRRVPRYHLSSTFHTHSRTRTHLLPDPPARDLTRLITCTASTQRRLDDPAYREANEKLFQSVHLRPLRTIILLLARASPRFVPRIESNDNENIFIHIFRTRKIKRGRGWNSGNCPFVRLRRGGEGRVYTFRNNKFFRTDGAHRHSHKQADATVYSHADFLLFPLFVSFPPDSVLDYSVSLSPRALPRSLFHHHVQGKPINHRIPRVYCCGTPASNHQQQVPRLLYSATRLLPSRADVLATFANYWPVLTCTLPPPPSFFLWGRSKANIGNAGERKESETRLRAPSSFRLVILPRVYSVGIPSSYAGGGGGGKVSRGNR